MHTRVRPQAAAVIALAASAALALAGCTAAADTAAGPAAAPVAASTAPASPPAKATPKSTGAPLGRDAVDGEVRAALRAAGIDPAKGKSTAETTGRKNPSLVDWTAVLPTQQADFALPRIGEQLQHLGWQPHSVGSTATLSYEKTDWVLLVGSAKQADGVALRQGESLLTVNVTYLGAG
ncbi:hypothetical protein ACGFYQ_33485 [Streptomyces sp. NPDC048258]|uniref:hypothetical protein n=1 Tax=Streptomyces sp. NPDC048258 TaxID=3365527 RepID=UPI00371103B8